MNKELEEGQKLQLDFQKLKKIGVSNQWVIPVVAQHALTGEVLIVAYANQDALKYTQDEKVATFWSTSRNELWIKGATSGDLLEVTGIYVNCEQNALLYKVIPKGDGVCHTKDEEGFSRETCFYREIVGDHLYFDE
jgi:phosphoribosyl-AMP cyclohydrolase